VLDGQLLMGSPHCFCSSYILLGMLDFRATRKVAGGERRDPQRTRERLLQAAFREIHKSGFRGTDLDTILRTAGVTKGAMYDHFDEGFRKRTAKLFGAGRTPSRSRCETARNAEWCAAACIPKK
jgi:hypothetical protein